MAAFSPAADTTESSDEATAYTRPSKLRVGRGRISVLFLHGFNSSPHTLREWAKLTADAGYRVSLPRLPGHGTDWRELDATRWRDWYASAERELLTLAAYLESISEADDYRAIEKRSWRSRP